MVLMKVWFLNLIILIFKTKAELFTSIARLNGLLHSTNFIMDVLHNTTAKSPTIDRVVEELRILHETDVGGDLTIAEHPVGAYHLIRVFRDLKTVLSRNPNLDRSIRRHLRSLQAALPNEVDYHGAMESLIRLQKMYHLPTEDLFLGTVNGKEAPGLGARDAYFIGNLARSLFQDAWLAYEWWSEALEAHEVSPELTEREYDKLLRKLEEANENITRSETLSENDNHEYTNDAEEIKTDDEQNEMDEQEESFEEEEDPEWMESYMALCRGDTNATDGSSSTSFCTMVSGLAPYDRFKLEVLSVEPFIVMFYDVITDEEADGFISRATAQLTRAEVGDGEVTSDRIGQLAWLDDEDIAVRTISRRISSLIGLSVNLEDEDPSAEQFQVVNYGIGGQYEPHMDTMDEDDAAYYEGVTDRLGTFLLYLNEIGEGGATVFPNANVKVHPVKNSAAYWFNMQRSGERDPLALHAGCPVLLGQKWIANKWLLTHGQEFLHRCGPSPESLHHNIHPKLKSFSLRSV